MGPSTPTDKQETAAGLRERAERQLAKTPPEQDTDAAVTDMRHLVQELRVHQIELEMQNEELRHAQLELAQSRDRYASLYHFAPVGYLTLDPRGRIEDANLTVASMLGTERGTLLKSSISRFIARGSQDAMYLHLRAVQSGRLKQSCEIDMEKPDGTRLAVRMESIGFGAPPERHCRTSVIDISESRLAEHALQASEKRFRRLTNALTDYIFHVPLLENGSLGKFVHSANSEAVTGYRPEELEAMGDPAAKLVHPDDRARFDLMQKAVLTGVDVPPAEFRIVTRDGQVRWVLQTLSSQRDASGKVVAVDGLLRDITRQKTAEHQLRSLNIELEQSLAERTSELHYNAENVKLMAAALARLGDGVIIASCSPQGSEQQIVFANHAMTGITGLTPGELIGKPLETLDDDDASGSLASTVAPSIPGLKNSGKADVRVRGGEGRYRDFEVASAHLYDTSGQMTHLVTIYRDITERKEAETRLRDSEQRIQAILNTVADAVFTVGIDARIEDMNPATEQLFGYTREELPGTNAARLLAGHSINPFSTGIEDLLQGSPGYYRELTACRKDGSLFPIGLSIREIDHQKSFTCVVRDLSLNRAMQKQILDIVGDEDRRIAQELHDNIQQQLLGIRLLADGLTATDHKEPATHSTSPARLIGAIDQCINDLHILCRGMLPLQVDGDSLRSALNKLADGIQELSGLGCSFNATGKVILEDNAVAGHIYRIAQEALNNIIKHANARHISVSLLAEAGQLILEVADDGMGIGDRELEPGGMGLQIMRYRAELVGGELDIRRGHTGGTVVTFSLPRHPHPGS